MSLPKLTAINYSITLPVSDIALTVRPFLVKEEKVLMIAFESGEPNIIIQAISDTIKACTVEDINPMELPLVDVEYLIIKMKGFSRGESIDLTMKCSNTITDDDGEKSPCGYEADISVSLENLERDMDTSGILPASIQLSDNIGVNLRPPRFHCMASIMDKDVSEGEHIMHVLVDSIESVWTKDEVFPASSQTYEDLENFIGEMDIQNFEKLKDYFASIPSVQLKEDYTCPRCKHRETVNIRNLNDFFL